MKLKHKRTGKIGILIVDGAYKFVTNFAVEDDEMNRLGEYNSLAELNEEWEDYKEPKKHCSITQFGDVVDEVDGYMSETIDEMKEIGNYFETEEEAEEAVRKLKAWKRLKDGGITFKNWTINQTGTIDCFATCGDNIPPSRKNPTLLDDLDLLFGGEK